MSQSVTNKINNYFLNSNYYEVVFWVCILGTHSFPDQSLLLSTTVL